MNSIEMKTALQDKKSLSLNAIVKNIMSKDGINKGMDIAASKIHFEIKNDAIEGSIDDESGYIFKIDPINQLIAHDCPDFIANLSKKILCKHFYRIFMILKRKNPDLTKEVLTSLYTKKDKWKFVQSES